MIKKYRVIITPQAQQQLMSIKDYILLELKSPIAARNTLVVPMAQRCYGVCHSDVLRLHRKVM